MDRPGISLFNPDQLNILHEAEAEEEQEDANEALQIEQQIDQGLSQAFDDLDSNLGSNPCDTPPMREFRKLVPENSPMQSTPIYGEEHYIKAGNRNEELKILYEARGKEINRLNEEIQALSTSKDAELRICRHKLNILEADKNNLMTNVEQLNELLRGGTEENRALREEINSFKSEKDIDLQRNREMSDKFENSEYMARQQHDAIVRSLKERHETQIYNLQEEIDKLYSQVRRQEAEVSDLRTKIIQKDLVEPSREMEERVRERNLRIENLSRKLKEKEETHSHILQQKSEVITKLKARLDENQKRVSELISEKISTKQLENDIKIAEMTLKSLQKENEELRVNTNAIEMKAQHFEALALQSSAQEPDPQIQAALQKSSNDVRLRDMEISKLQRKLASLKTEPLQLNSNKSQGTEEFTEKVKNLTEELSRVTNKYLTLKRKVKAYQDHCQRKEKHFQDEIKRMENEYKSMLFTLKSKMENAYNTKEQQIEIELMEMKDHFYLELEKITSLDKEKRPLDSPAEDEFLNGISECSSASKKENMCPSSRLEEVDRFFARAQEDARNKIANLQITHKPIEYVIFMLRVFVKYSGHYVK
ncbi:unnamed protein product [Lepeophtheirus salmonis]|uniref:(salmon louse) hypothetical protein n=2 Tax=Lepeophtheirus salmonis TaxID=72036 RepID=A0A7R8GZM8_LEPSM|nr:unnamed protein product [Lepeophtheirus salmonis]CAF2756019.1 unnamed protein product [Lepeophtheirus salmonis]